MLSTDLTGVALSLMKNPRFYCVAGVVHAFRNMHDAPSPLAIQHAIESLAYLGALQKFPDQTVRLSDLGLAMADLPVSPEMARSLIFSRVFGCHPEVLRIAAVMGEEQYTELFVTDPDARHRMAIRSLQNTETPLGSAGEHWTCSWSTRHCLSIRTLRTQSSRSRPPSAWKTV